MTETTQAPSRAEVERAVVFAVRAPSIHNTQPWRWVYRAGALELARLGLAAGGWRTEVDRLPDAGRPDLLGRIRTMGRGPVEPAVVERAEAAERRHTERRP